MSGEMDNLVVKVNVKKNVEEGLMMANTELLKAWVSSVRKIWSQVRQMGLSGLLQSYPGWLWGYPSYLNALSVKISLSQGGMLMRKFSGEAS
jgi:hypothetical protein